mgnify:FL=1
MKKTTITCDKCSEVITVCDRVDVILVSEEISGEPNFKRVDLCDRCVKELFVDACSGSDNRFRQYLYPRVRGTVATKDPRGGM